MHGKGGIDFSGFSRFWSALKGDEEVRIKVVAMVLLDYGCVGGDGD
jgi:hypothetical protein